MVPILLDAQCVASAEVSINTVLCMCLAPKAQHSSSALGSAQGKPSMQSISAEGAIHCRVESRFQRSFGMQPEILGRCPRLM